MTPTPDSAAPQGGVETICAKLREKVHNGQYAIGGGSMGWKDGKPFSDSWGGEKIMVYRNPDGPAAAALIEALASSPPAQQAGVEDALREVLENAQRDLGLILDNLPLRSSQSLLRLVRTARARARAALRPSTDAAAHNQDIGPPVYLGGAGLTAVEIKDIDTAGLSGGYGVGDRGADDGVR